MSLKIRMLWGDLYNARTEHKVTKYKLEKAKNEKGKLRDELNQFKSNRSRETKLLEDEVKSPKKQLHVYRPPSGTKRSVLPPTAARSVQAPSGSTGFFFNNSRLSDALQANVAFRSAYAVTYGTEP
ncbi:hypothetical protein AAVH_19430 [Aphelenchoides avenae]|nr:hypothetical protein AAVH_19430 [Aphelenchus avenae]